MIIGQLFSCLYGMIDKDSSSLKGKVVMDIFLTSSISVCLRTYKSHWRTLPRQASYPEGSLTSSASVKCFCLGLFRWVKVVYCICMLYFGFSIISCFVRSASVCSRSCVCLFWCPYSLWLLWSIAGWESVFPQVHIWCIWFALGRGCSVTICVLFQLMWGVRVVAVVYIGWESKLEASLGILGSCYSVPLLPRPTLLV